MSGLWNLPQPHHKEIFEGLMEQYLKQKDQEETAKYHQGTLDEQNRYHTGELDLRRQQLAKDDELKPLKLDLLKAKIKAAQKEGMPELTKSTITNNQKIVENVDNLHPQLDDLIKSDNPGQLVGKYFHPDKQADYEAKIGLLADSLLGALGLPKTDQSLLLAKSMVGQKSLESHDAYVNRLKKLKEDLSQRKVKALRILKDKNALETNGTEGKEGSPSELTYNIETGDFE